MQQSSWRALVQGLSVDETGKQHYLDASVAYKRAVLNCIDYLSKFGYTKEQARLRQPASCRHSLQTLGIWTRKGLELDMMLQGAAESPLAPAIADYVRALSLQPKACFFLYAAGACVWGAK